MRARGIALLIVAVVAGVATASVAYAYDQGSPTGAAGIVAPSSADLAAAATRTVTGPVAPPPPSEERTYPQVRPSSGRRRTTFALTFTLRESPGQGNAFDVIYRVQVAALASTRPSCTPALSPSIESGEVGTVAQVKLAPPEHGWCVGRYRATVLLQRSPYCPPPPVEGKTEIACPLVIEELATGHADFTVRAKAARRHRSLRGT